MLYPHRSQILTWLWVCIAMVFAMVILGGSVRLTGSGLSMVDWKPILGIIPPLNHTGWIAAFEQYQQYPEYQLVNRGMTLSEFKFIFMMEYLHRVLGRLIGLVFFLPFCFFLFRGGMPASLSKHLWFLLFLGACQGLMGWYMVKSGLINEPHVSQYRLTAHLMLAVVIYAIMLRLAFDLFFQSERSTGRTVSAALSPRMTRGAGILVVLVLLMIATGGLMAGTRAGHIFNTWPLMGNALIPDMLLAMQPSWRNFFENTITIQFVHRWLAIVVAVSVIWFSLVVARSNVSKIVQRLAIFSIFAIILQVLLGILTLLNAVPAALGVAHQGCALVVLAGVIGVWTSSLPSVSHSPADQSLI